MLKEAQKRRDFFLAQLQIQLNECVQFTSLKFNDFISLYEIISLFIVFFDFLSLISFVILWLIEVSVHSHILVQRL